MKWWVGLALATMILLFAVAPVLAHDWYSDQRRPGTNILCCNGNDCAPVPAHEVRAASGGWMYIPLGQTIPFKEVLPSQDNSFHVCIMGGQLRCLFIPPIPNT